MGSITELILECNGVESGPIHLDGTRTLSELYYWLRGPVHGLRGLVLTESKGTARASYTHRER
jgi:hypothetical protein